MTNFQRKSAASNTQVGRHFESKAKAFFLKQGFNLQTCLKPEIGICNRFKVHTFDFGNQEKRIIVECKSQTWTEGWN